MKWYCVLDQEQVGPLSNEDFQELVEKGRVNYDTLVWNTTMADWTRYGNLWRSSQGEQTSTQQQVTCVECGNSFSKNEVISYGDSRVCASCKPLFLQKLKEGVDVSQSLSYAGFWIRAAAMIIDGIVLWIVQMILFIPYFSLFLTNLGEVENMEQGGGEPENMGMMIAVQLILTVVQFGVAVAYETWFIGRFNATLGKMACRIEVLKSDGSNVGYLLAFGRYFAKMVSGMILGIGYIMAAFDSEKRALHDHMCNTRVVHKK